MSGFLRHVPFRESRVFIAACAVLFLVFAGVLLSWPKPVRQEKAIAKKKEEHKLVPPEMYVPVWLRKGWELDTAVAGVLLLLSPWLGRRWRADAKGLAAPERKPVSRWSLLGIGALMLFAGWQNYPRLFLSMWGDEEFNASRFIVDEASRERDDALEITPRPWTTTLWWFRKTTNHLGFSAVARLCHDTFFVKKTGPRDPWFSEALIRMPVFIAGLLFIPALFWAGRVWGISPWLPLLLGVIHPWYLRFGVDGRGYGLVMLGVPVMLGLLGRGLQTGRWHWWILLGFTEFFVFWSYFGSVYLLLMLNAAALGLILSGSGEADVRLRLLSRWVVSGAVAKMLVIGVMAPCWPQLFEFLEQKPIAGVLDWPWWRDSFSEFFLGAPWADQAPGNPDALSITTLVPRREIMRMIALAAWLAFALAAGLGAWRLARSRERRWLLLVILGAPALMLAHMAHSGIRPYSWYLVPYLPGLLLLLGRLPSSGMRCTQWPLAAKTLFVSAAIFVMIPTREIYRTHPIEPSRESVALYRQVTNPRNPDIDKEVISGGFVFYTEGYDPALYRFKDAAGLRALMTQAGRERKKLFINVGMIEFARQQFPDITKILDDSAQFEHVKTLYGLLPSTTREVYRWKGQ